MKKFGFLLAAAVLFVAAPTEARRKSGLRYEAASVGVYGAKSLTGEQISEKLKATIDDYMNLMGKRSKVARVKADGLHRRLEDAVKEMGRFGWTRLSVVETERSGGTVKVLLLFDAIEREDMATRFPFRSEPAGQVEDTSGLIADWGRYTSLAWDKVTDQGISLERVDCAAFYCPEGAATPETRRIEERFQEAVPAYGGVLNRILREDKDPDKRSKALYLLTYLKDGSEVARMVAHGLLDPAQSVRQAAMAVFSDLAVHHPEVPLPVHEAARAMDFPYPADRNRSLALMLSLADIEDYRPFLLGSAAKKIIHLLRSAPNGETRSLAHTVLTLLSGEDFGPDDPDRWQKWLEKAQAEQAGKR